MSSVSNITVCENVTLVTFCDVTYDNSSLCSIFELFEENNINIDMISLTSSQSSKRNLSFTVDNNAFIKLVDILSKFKEKNPDIKLMICTGNCKISLYGTQMKDCSGVASKAVTSLLKNNIDINVITTSDVDISLLIAQSSLNNAFDILKNEFNIDC